MSGVTRLTPRFLVKQWPDGAVVFDCRLGHTHALNAAAAQLFFAVCEAPELAGHALAPSLANLDSEAASDAWRSLRDAGLLD